MAARSTHPPAGKTVIVWRLALERHRPGVPEAERWLIPRGPRAKLKSRMDDSTLAQGKRRAALGCRPIGIPLLFNVCQQLRRLEPR